MLKQCIVKCNKAFHSTNKSVDVNKSFYNYIIGKKRESLSD